MREEQEEDEEGSCRVHCLAASGEPGLLTVVAGGQEVVVWQQGVGGARRGRSLALRQGLDSGSEEEDEQEEGEELGEQTVVFSNKPNAGFCNCAVM